MRAEYLLVTIVLLALVAVINGDRACMPMQTLAPKLQQKQLPTEEIESEMKCFRKRASSEKTAAAYFDYGFALELLEKYDAAIPILRKAESLAPNWAGPAVNLCISLAVLGTDDEETALACERAQELDPTSTAALENAARSRAKLGQLDIADSHYRDALRVKQTFSLYIGAANVSLLLGDASRAVALFEKGLKYVPDNTPQASGIIHQYGLALLSAGRLEDGFRQLNKALQSNPVLFDMSHNMTSTWRYLPPFDEPPMENELLQRTLYNSGVIQLLRYAVNHTAESLLASASSVFGKSGMMAMSSVGLGTAHFLKGNYTASLSAFSQAIAQHKGLTGQLAKCGLGHTLLMMGLPHLANRVTMQCLNDDNSYHIGYNNFGVSWMALNDTKTAEFYFQLALHLDPEYAEAHENYATLLLKNDKIDDAIVHGKEAQRIYTLRRLQNVHRSEHLQVAQNALRHSLSVQKSRDLNPDLRGILDADVVVPEIDWSVESALHSVRLSDLSFPPLTVLSASLQSIMSQIGCSADDSADMMSNEAALRPTQNIAASDQGKSYNYETDPIVIVTAASAGFFDRLMNFVGSVHVHEPTATIVIYDLGLTRDQREEAEKWLNTEVHTFDSKQYEGGTHLWNIRNYAWKPIIMHDALQRYDQIIFEDAGQELRASVRGLWSVVREEGHKFVVQHGLKSSLRCCGDIGELTHDQTYRLLGVDKTRFADQHMCAGGIQAYRKGSIAYEQVLLPALECALKEACIAPSGATQGNHRFDQSVFSILIHKAGLYCDTNTKYWSNFANTLESIDDVVLFSRRYQYPKTYSNLILYKEGTKPTEISLEASVSLYSSALVLLLHSPHIPLENYEGDLDYSTSRSWTTEIRTAKEQTSFDAMKLAKQFAPFSAWPHLGLAVFGMLHPDGSDDDLQHLKDALDIDGFPANYHALMARRYAQTRKPATENTVSGKSSFHYELADSHVMLAEKRNAQSFVTLEAKGAFQLLLRIQALGSNVLQSRQVFPNKAICGQGHVPPFSTTHKKRAEQNALISEMFSSTKAMLRMPGVRMIRSYLDGTAINTEDLTTDIQTLGWIVQCVYACIILMFGRIWPEFVPHSVMVRHVSILVFGVPLFILSSARWKYYKPFFFCCCIVALGSSSLRSRSHLLAGNFQDAFPPFAGLLISILTGASHILNLAALLFFFALYVLTSASFFFFCADADLEQLVKFFFGIVGILAPLLTYAVMVKLMQSVVKLQSDKLRASRDQALEISELKSQFVATMSHEIRTPLNGVIGLSELLLRSGLTADQRHWVETVQTSGRVLLSLANQVLDFSRLEAGKLELREEEVNLQRIVEDVLQVCAVTARDGVDLVSYIDPRLPRTVISDDTRLQQILINLLGNASKFTHKGQIEIRMEPCDLPEVDESLYDPVIPPTPMTSPFSAPLPSPFISPMPSAPTSAPTTPPGSQPNSPRGGIMNTSRMFGGLNTPMSTSSLHTPTQGTVAASVARNERIGVRIRVKDSGIGISAEHISRLFLPFTQADSSTTRKYGGSGLGLTIVRKLAEMMRGTVTVNSVLGEGTEFVVEISCISVVGRNYSARLQKAQTLANQKVMFVSAKPPVVDAYASVLRDRGAEVTCCIVPIETSELSTVTSAIERAGGLTKSHVCIIDVDALFGNMSQLPDALPPCVGVIALSTRDHPIPRSDQLTVVQKPVAAHSMVEAVIRVVSEASGGSRAHSLAIPPLRLIMDSPTAPTIREGVHILMAEDYVVNQMVMKLMLTKLGCTVDVADDGAIALKKFQESMQLGEKRYDIILMDMQMPVMDGAAATKAIREFERTLVHRSHVPIIAVSASTLREEVESSLRNGMDTHISKPVSMETLVQTLSSFV